MFRGEKQQGFTLIELMVVVALIAIIITLSTPLSNLYKQNRVTSLEHEFVTSLNLARSSAVGTAASVSVCIRNLNPNDPNNPNPCDAAGRWEQGWIVFNDPNANGQVDAGETILQQHDGFQAAGYTLGEIARTVVTYNASGLTPTSAGTWTLCTPSRDITFQRNVNLSVTGRVTMQTPDQVQNLNLGCF